MKFLFYVETLFTNQPRPSGKSDQLPWPGMARIISQIDDKWDIDDGMTFLHVINKLTWLIAFIFHVSQSCYDGLSLLHRVSE